MTGAEALRPEDRAEMLLATQFPLLAGLADEARDNAPLDEAHWVDSGVYDRLPVLVAGPAAMLADDVERDVFALSALVAASVALPNVRFNHRMRAYDPPLFLAHVGPAASGKSAALFGLRLLDAVGERFASLPPFPGGDGIERRPRLRLAANASEAALVGQLEANGGVGVVESTEIDALLSATSNTWGNLSHILRQAFEHEPASMLRVAGSRHVARPSLAVVLAGTPEQYARMFVSAEDGLLSRFAFNVSIKDVVWDSGGGSDPDAFDGALSNSAAELGAVYGRLLERTAPVHLTLDDDGRATLDFVFRRLVEWSKGADEAGDFTSSVVRGGVVALRYAAVITALQAEGRFAGDRSVLAPEALTAGIALALHHLDNGFRLTSLLPRRVNRLGGGNRLMEKLLSELPGDFTRQEAVGVGASMSIPERTVDSYLARMKRDGTVRAGERFGSYTKGSRYASVRLAL